MGSGVSIDATAPEASAGCAVAPRVLLDISLVYEFGCQPPNKFTRLHDQLRRAFPEAIEVRLRSDGFQRESLSVSRSGNVACDRLARCPVAQIRLFAPQWWRARLLLPLLVAGLRCAPIARTRKWLQHVGAFELHRSFAGLKPEKRLFYYDRFGIAEGGALMRSFFWWMRKDFAQSSSAPPYTLAAAAEPLAASDLVIVSGVVAGMPVPRHLEALRDQCAFRLAVICLDSAPLSAPAVLPSQSYGRFCSSLALHIAAADMILTPSAFAAKALTHFAEKRGLTMPAVRVQRPYLAVPALDGQSLSPPEPFALAITPLTGRRNISWLFLLWKAAQAKFGARLPPLVIVTSSLSFGPVTADRDFDLGGRLRIVWQPDDEMLHRLIERAAFLVHVPSDGGAGTTLTEAVVFGKTCLCEDHPAYADIIDETLIKRPLDLQAWLQALTSLIDGGIGGRHAAPRHGEVDASISALRAGVFAALSAEAA